MMNLQTATFGNGCFWCTEAIFQQLKGVETVTSGYAGGEGPAPKYEEMHGNNRGFSESIQITFNPEVLSYKDLMKVFFLTHNPTTLNQQGNDVGEEYRSVIFYHDEEQRKLAEESKAELQSLFDDPIVTAIEAFKNFYKAEDYHQNFYKNNPDYGYCAIIIEPKIAKFRKEFIDKLK